jgi:DNA-binding LacI/PurR family transcriptional regulator
MRPTLQTVADAVGVSRSTVSNAYSRPDQLSPELRQRILSVARTLGYAGPHPVARTLRRGRVGALGVLFTDTLADAFADPYSVQFLRGLAQTAERHATSLVLIPLPGQDVLAAAETLRNAVVDGFCVYCVPDWHVAMAEIRGRGLPVVTESVHDGEFEAMSVGIDERAAARAGAEHLVRLGHRRIAVIFVDLTTDNRPGPVDLSSPEAVWFHLSRERLRGIRDAFAAVGVDWADIVAVNATANTREAGAAAAAHALDRAGRCTAVLTYSDVLALGVLDAVADRGLRPGRDVSVVGFDDIPEAAQAHLTTVRQPSVQKGARAAELLLDPPTDPADGRVLLPTELIVRSSTGPVEGSPS